MNKYIFKGINLKRASFIEETINYFEYAIKNETNKEILNTLNGLLKKYKEEHKLLCKEIDERLNFFKSKYNCFLCVKYKEDKEYVRPIKYIKENNYMLCDISKNDKYYSGIKHEFINFDNYLSNDLEIHEITKEEFINRAKNGIDELINS